MAPVRYANPEDLRNIEADLFKKAATEPTESPFTEYSLLQDITSVEQNNAFANALFAAPPEEDEWEFKYPQKMADGIYEVYQNKRTGEHKEVKVADLPSQPISMAQPEAVNQRWQALAEKPQPEIVTPEGIARTQELYKVPERPTDYTDPLQEAVKELSALKDATRDPETGELVKFNKETGHYEQFQYPLAHTLGEVFRIESDNPLYAIGLMPITAIPAGAARLFEPTLRNLVAPYAKNLTGLVTFLGTMAIGALEEGLGIGGAKARIGTAMDQIVPDLMQIAKEKPETARDVRTIIQSITNDDHKTAQNSVRNLISKLEASPLAEQLPDLPKPEDAARSLADERFLKDTPEHEAEILRLLSERPKEFQDRLEELRGITQQQAALTTEAKTLAQEVPPPAKIDREYISSMSDNDLLRYKGFIDLLPEQNPVLTSVINDEVRIRNLKEPLADISDQAITWQDGPYGSTGITADGREYSTNINNDGSWDVWFINSSGEAERIAKNVKSRADALIFADATAKINQPLPDISDLPDIPRNREEMARKIAEENLSRLMTFEESSLINQYAPNGVYDLGFMESRIAQLKQEGYDVNPDSEHLIYDLYTRIDTEVQRLLKEEPAKLDVALQTERTIAESGATAAGRARLAGQAITWEDLPNGSIGTLANGNEYQITKNEFGKYDVRATKRGLFNLVFQDADSIADAKTAAATDASYMSVQGKYPEEIAGGPKPLEPLGTVIDLSDSDLETYYRIIRNRPKDTNIEQDYFSRTYKELKRRLMAKGMSEREAIEFIDGQDVGRFLPDSSSDIIAKAEPKSIYIPDKEIESRVDFETQLKAAFNLNDDQAKLFGDLTEARARIWAKQNKTTVDEWYKTHLASITQEAPSQEVLDKLQDVSKGGKLRALVEPLDDGRVIIRALEQPDLFSVAHELGHVFRRDLNEADMNVLRSWTAREIRKAGKTGFAISDLEELFANGFVQYMKDGSAPTPEIRGLFERFKEWLGNIWRAVSGQPMKIDISDEMRGVYDRLLNETDDVTGIFDRVKRFLRPLAEAGEAIGEEATGLERAIEEPEGVRVPLTGRRGAGGRFETPTIKAAEPFPTAPGFRPPPPDPVRDYQSLQQNILRLNEEFGGIRSSNPAIAQMTEELTRIGQDIRRAFTPEQEANYQALVRGATRTPEEAAGQVGVPQAPRRVPVEPTEFPGTAPRAVGQEELGIPTGEAPSLTQKELEAGEVGVRQPMGTSGYPTVQQITRNLTPEEQAAARELEDLGKRVTGLPEERPVPVTRNPIHRVGDFYKIADKQIEQYATDYKPGRIGSKLQALQTWAQTGKSGMIRSAFQIAEPVQAAIAREAAGSPVAMTFVRRDLYLAEQQAEIMAKSFDWMYRSQESLGLTMDGFARNVPVKPGVDIPESMMQRIDDINLHPGDYILTPEQKAFLQEIEDTTNEIELAQLKMGIVPRKSIARIITEFPSGVTRENVRRADVVEFVTTVTDMREGARKGYSYMNPLDAYRTQWIDATQRIANRQVRDSLRTLGKTPGEKVNAALKAIIDRGGEDLTAAKKQAAQEYQVARKSGDPIEIAAAEERLRRAQSALRSVHIMTEEQISEAAELGLEEGRLGRLFPANIAKEIDEYYRFGPGDRDYFNEIMQLWRATRTVGDYSQLGVQGFNLLVTNPALWTKVSVSSILASFENNMPIKYVSEHIDDIMDGIRYGAITPPSEFLLSAIPNSADPNWIEKTAHTFGRIPMVKGTQRSFEWFTFLGQTEMWMMRKGMIEAGASPNEVASFVRKSLGVVLRPGQTRKGRDISQGLLFAHRFATAVTSLDFDALRGGARGQLARETWARWFTAGTAFTIAAELAINGKLPNYTDPSRSDFGSVHTKGGILNFYGPRFPYYRAFIRAGQATKEGKPADAIDDMYLLALGRTSLPLSSAITLLTGTNAFTGEELKQFEDRNAWVRAIKSLYNRAEIVVGENLGPIGPTSNIAYFFSKPENQPLFWEIVSENFGGRATPYSPTQYRNILRDQYSLDAHGKLYDNLTEKQKLEIDSRKDVAMASEFAQKANIERGGPTGRYQQALLDADTRFAQTMTGLIRSPNYTGLQYREKRSEAMKLRAAQRDIADKAYAPYRGTDLDNTTEPKVQAIFDLNMDTKDPKTGLSYSDMNMEWKFFEDRDALIKALTPEQKQDYESLSQRYILKLPQALQAKELEYKHDMDLLRTYWDIQPLVANAFGAAGEAYMNVKRLESARDPRAREFKKVLGDVYNRIDGMVSDSRENLRKYNPEIDLALKKWGYTSRLMIEPQWTMYFLASPLCQ